MSKVADLNAALNILKKYNLKETEAVLRREGGSNLLPSATGSIDTEGLPNEFLEKGIDEATQYEEKYEEFIRFIDTVLDSHKAELGGLSYPVFVHFYLRLVGGGYSELSLSFFRRFSICQESYHCEYLNQLSNVTLPSHISSSPLLEGFRSGQYVVSMSKESHQILKHFLSDRAGQIIDSVIDHIQIDEFSGPPRSKMLIDARRGGYMGEAGRDSNRGKVFYGIVKDSADALLLADELGDGEGDEDGPKKKKLKKDLGVGRKMKPDPFAPPSGRIPVPEVRDVEKLEKRTRLKDLQKRIKLSPQHLPSVCLYTMHNCSHGAECTTSEFSEDGTFLACGFSDSSIKVWSLTKRDGLAELRSAEELEKLDPAEADVHLKMLADRHADVRCLYGHSGPVFSISFSPNKQLLISGSADSTLRLWSLQLWSCLVTLKGHYSSIWSVSFSPLGHYFASGGADRVVRVWSTDHSSPLRMFPDHLSDIDCVKFHPNGNYIATGSSDKLVRLFDVVTSKCMRCVSGHKGSVTCITFTSDGRYLISGCASGIVIVFDISTGHQVAHLVTSSSQPIFDLSICRDNQVISAGGIDCTVRLWDFSKIVQNFQHCSTASGSPLTGTVVGPAANSCLLKSFYTKKTPITSLMFSRRNILLAAGYFEDS